MIRKKFSADALRSSQHQQRQRRQKKDAMKNFDNTKSINNTTDNNNDDNENDDGNDDGASNATLSSAKKIDRNDNEEEIAVDVETLKVMQGLETDICGGDYINFLNELDRRGTGGTTKSWKMKKTIILENFRLFRLF